MKSQGRTSQVAQAVKLSTYSAGDLGSTPEKSRKKMVTTNQSFQSLTASKVQFNCVVRIFTILILMQLLSQLCPTL